MRLISIFIGKQYLYYAIFDKNGETISLVESSRITVPQNQSSTELMNNIYTLSNNLLQNKNLNKAIVVVPSSNANITLSIMLANVMTSGIATLVCFNNRIEVDYKSTANIKPTKLGYQRTEKNSTVWKSMDIKFPNMTYKNDDMRKTVLLGYEELL